MPLCGGHNVTLCSFRRHLRIEAKAPYRGKVTAKQVQTPIATGVKRLSKNLSGLPKRLYAYTQNTFRAYAK